MILIVLSYVSARQWNDLVFALRSTSRGPFVDELIQLHDVGHQPVPPRAPHGVRITTFKVGDSITELLSTSVNAEAPKAAHGLEALIRVEQNSVSVIETLEAHGSDGTDTHGAPGDKEDINTHDHTMEEADPHDKSYDNIEDAIIAAPSSTVPSVTSEEHRAAYVIQKAYRNAVVRQRNAAALVIQEAYKRSLLRRQRMLTTRLSKKFSACLQIGKQSMSKENRKYHMFLFGPLPHLLLCLDAALATAHNQQATAKRDYGTASHAVFEILGKRLTELGNLKKNLIALQKQLEPNSDLHRRCDVAEMYGLVKKAAGQLENLPFEVADQRTFRQDLAIAVKGILKERQPPKAKPKPSLVWDD
ncbi:hypothetical protein H0H92_009732 [Tricholoma furcatifolium]|nr:hypothetical protein H0H92_009732 [Tricholoma furcatifolium]